MLNRTIAELMSQIENMHAFVGDISKLELPVLNPYLEKAQTLYNENMNAYISAILRRSFGKAMVSNTDCLTLHALA
jgi:hypothetical protein